MNSFLWIRSIVSTTEHLSIYRGHEPKIFSISFHLKLFLKVILKLLSYHWRVPPSVRNKCHSPSSHNLPHHTTKVCPCPSSKCVPLLSQFTFAATVVTLGSSYPFSSCVAQWPWTPWYGDTLSDLSHCSLSISLFLPHPVPSIPPSPPFTLKISATHETRKVLYKYDLVFEYFLIRQEENNGSPWVKEIIYNY